jgi:hypothetical protein
MPVQTRRYPTIKQKNNKIKIKTNKFKILFQLLLSVG